MRCMKYLDWGFQQTLAYFYHYKLKHFFLLDWD